MVRDVRDRLRRRGRVIQELRNRIAVDAHIGVVGVREQTHHAGLLRQNATPQLILPVFRMNLPGPPYQIDSVCNFRHEPFRKTEAPVAVLVIRDQSHGVTARVGGIIPRAVVIHRPVHELKMSVGAHRILIEEIRQAELAKADFQPPPRQLIKQRQGTALVLDLVSAQCEHLVDHAPARYGSLLSKGLRTISRSVLPANPSPVLSAAPPASSIFTRSSVESFSRTPVYNVITREVAFS